MQTSGTPTTRNRCPSMARRQRMERARLGTVKSSVKPWAKRWHGMQAERKSATKLASSSRVEVVARGRKNRPHAANRPAARQETPSGLDSRPRQAGDKEARMNLDESPDAEQPKDFVVAIDGPAGAGKSTIARHLARHFGLLNLETGAMYRAFALKALRAESRWTIHRHWSTLPQRLRSLLNRAKKKTACCLMAKM